MSAPAVRRPVIALLLNTLFDGYEDAIWRGAIRAAEEFDVDLLAFLGGTLNQAQHQSSVFDLVRAGTVDGVVLISPAIGFVCGPEGIASLVERLGPVPAVSLSERVRGVPSILVDNRAGMSQVVEHLVTVHGRRRIAFVQGPGSSSEARVRYQSYRDALARFGLPFDPALVAEGDHWPASGLRAVRTLLDDRRVSLDALVASNDLMAIAAMEELRRRGLNVPADVAVAGFDDIVDAASTSPPLTTARQPLYEMGREAIRKVLAMIRGEAVGPELGLVAQLLLRQSCGCTGLEGGAGVEGAAAGRAWSPEALAAQLEACFPDLGARLAVPSWASELAAALPTASGTGDDRAFLRALERLLSGGLAFLPEPGPWFRVLRELLARARQGTTAAHAARLCALSESAHALVGGLAAGAELARRMRTDVEARVLHRMIQPFPLPDDMLIRNLLSALDVLDVRSFFLSRYLDRDLREATLIAHRDPDGVGELSAPPGPFAAHRLIPGRFSGRRRTSHAVLPIQSPDGLIGFALCEIGAMNSSGYEMLMHQISVVLSVNGLMAEVQDQHRQLLDTARQAGMAEVAVGALHNVGNLLNSVNVSADQIRAAAATAAGSGLTRAAGLLTEQAADLPGFFARDPRGALLPAYLGKAVEALGQELARIQRESVELQEKTGLIRDSIRALQEHALGGPRAPAREATELTVLVRAVLEIQHAHLARWGVHVEQELDGLPPLVTQRSMLVHVLVNLVKNAVEAMRTTPEGRRFLRLRGVHQEDGRIRLEVKDSGEGIAPGDLDQIFSYGFSTKPDGHGFGLYTCARHMKQLGGSISVVSEGKGQGATFRLLLDPRGEGGGGAPPSPSGAGG